MKFTWGVLLTSFSAVYSLYAPEQEFLDPEAGKYGQNNLPYEIVTHPSFNNHRIRIVQPKLCDPDVKQYSGYLDISQSKHLFFWFFESRKNPQDAPFLLWLSGGPACSSFAAMLMELGPCNVVDEGHNVSYNPFSWTESANVPFLDQPVNVGYSYDDHYGSTVNTSSVGAQDVYAFFQLFFHRFPEYSIQPFHVAGESYGGVHAPHIASVMHKHNKQLASAPKLKHINLASLILVNGLTNPRIQYPSIRNYACGDGPYPVLDPSDDDCAALQTPTGICVQLTQQCYEKPSRYTCEPASVYCEATVLAPIFTVGMNPYDVRKSCDPSKLMPPCYEEMGWITT